MTSIKGFTLIEMSMVLVIIGLVVGGVLVGQDLIRAGYVRAQISQIEKFNTAANTFYGKYQALPGDMNNSTALAYGFTPRPTDCGGVACPGEGNGDGLIQGIQGGPTTNGNAIAGGETGMFWVDLSHAGLIDGGFSSATPQGLANSVVTSATGVGLYLPAAKLGRGNYVYVYNPTGENYYTPFQYLTNNWFGLSIISLLNGDDVFGGGVGLTVLEAYRIDSKIDDGNAITGRIIAMYLNFPNTLYGASGGTPSTAILAGDVASSSTSCYNSDDNGTNNPWSGVKNSYTISYQNGVAANTINCALSFQMQAGD